MFGDSTEFKGIMQANRDNFPAREAFTEGQRQYSLGHLSEAIVLLRHSVLLYAEMDTPQKAYLFIPNLRVERGLACETCADYLVEAEQYPEAASLFQEAVNVYQSTGNPAVKVEDCARKAVAAINALRLHPEERLQLLIARHERQRQQLALRENTEMEQASILIQIGQICVRRERYPQAHESYEEALRLLLMVSPRSLSLLYTQGVCHHQLGNLAFYRFKDFLSAEAHYRTALTDFEPCQELEEYDATAADMCRYTLAEVVARIESISPAHLRLEESE